MLDFEAALARAQARAGLLSGAAAAAIAEQCRAERFDIDALAAAAAQAGNPAIPLVRALTALVAANDAEAARFVHWGATSQDAMDTGLVLQLRARAGGRSRPTSRACPPRSPRSPRSTRGLCSPAAPGCSRDLR